ncbi:hypothetical protein ACFPT5_07170 [Ornithinimicrobium kibberense]
MNSEAKARTSTRTAVAVRVSRPRRVSRTGAGTGRRSSAATRRRCPPGRLTAHGATAPDTGWRSAVAVLMVVLLGIILRHAFDSTSVLLIARTYDFVDTPVEHMFATGWVGPYAVCMSGTQTPTTDRPSDLA